MIKFLLTLLGDLLRSDAETDESADQSEGRFFTYMTGEAVDLPTAGDIYDVDLVDEKHIDDVRS